jgi:hypothetical protein
VQTVHPRSSWQDPARPITGLPAEWGRVTMNVAHYTADDDLIDGDPGEFYDRLDEYMRAMQASYLNSRKYSLGYLWAVDWLGGAWEIRGWDFKSAANVGDKRKTGVANVNPMTAPILYLVDGNDSLTSYAAATGRALGLEAEHRAGRKLGRPKPHSALDFTSCCGDGIRRDIELGRLDPEARVNPPYYPPVTVEEDMPKLVIKDVRPPNAVWLSDGHTKSWVDSGATATQLDQRLAESKGGTVASPIDGFVYRLLEHGSDDVIASYGPVVGPVPDGFDAWGRLR